MVNRDIHQIATEIADGSESESPYALAILREGDEEHYLFMEFWNSLSEIDEVLLNSIGYLGNLESNVKEFKHEKRKRFYVLKVRSWDNISKDYFTSKLDAALIDLDDDDLIVKVLYTKPDNDYIIGKWQSEVHEGSIEEIIKLYEEFSSKNPRQLLIEGFNKHEFLREHMTRKKWIIAGKTISVPMYISIGIELCDEKYLLNTTGALGPYVVELEYDKK